MNKVHSWKLSTHFRKIFTNCKYEEVFLACNLLVVISEIWNMTSLYLKIKWIFTIQWGIVHQSNKAISIEYYLQYTNVETNFFLSEWCHQGPISGLCLPTNSVLTIAYMQAPNFCASLVSVECLVTWSMHAQKPKITANPWSLLAVSTDVRTG